jgi:hypothetical protein
VGDDANDDEGGPVNDEGDVANDVGENCCCVGKVDV